MVSFKVVYASRKSFLKNKQKNIYKQNLLVQRGRVLVSDKQLSTLKNQLLYRKEKPTLF